MASIKSLETLASAFPLPLPPPRLQPREHADPSFLQIPSSRRSILLFAVLPLGLVVLCAPSLARDRRTKKTIPLEDYEISSNGLKYYDRIESKGPTAEKGSTVQVHFDCVYRGITAVSSRESKLLAGNHIIAQVGAPPDKEQKQEYVDYPKALFSAQTAPKPTPAVLSN